MATPKRAPARRPTAPKATPSKGTKTYKFASLTAEAKQKMDARAKERPEIPPFIMDDVEPPIVITAPDNVERMLVSAEAMHQVEAGDMGGLMPLLRAMCGDAFPRVWYLVREDSGPDRMMAVAMALTKHFEGAIAPYLEAAELPGGSEDSSD